MLFSVTHFTTVTMAMGTTHHHHHPTMKPNHFHIKKLIPWLLYILLPLAILHLYLSSFSSPATSPNDTPSTSVSVSDSVSSSSSYSQTVAALLPPSLPSCNFSDGQWVPHSGGPLYSGTACKTIKNGQNCMEHGRPDTGYLHWRWQPRRCSLPRFDPAAFLDLIADKHLAFVGDSMARNQLESLLCLLAVAEEPDLVYRDGKENKSRRWIFRRRNATVSVLWSPFLVKGVEKDEPAGLKHNTLFLETADDRWATELDGIDVVLFSAGHWYLLPAIYHEHGVVLGCHACPDFNLTEIGFFDVFRKAVRAALGEVSRRQHSSGEKLVLVTTFSPAHFEGEWDKAGACPKRKPYEKGEKEMGYTDALMRRIAVEEVAAADSRGGGGGGKIKMETLDVTEMALLRPDGHPGPYMHPHPFAGGEVRDRVQNDCVHWCLPGPIDSWNEILLQLIRRWKKGSH